ncbi:hypothetical protein HK104_011407, partial [Borealophlyctis nickersoniae]
MKAVSALLSLALLAQGTYAQQPSTYVSLKLQRDASSHACTVISSGPTQRHASLRADDDVVIRTSPAVREEEGVPKRTREGWGDIVDVVGVKEERVWAMAGKECPGGITEKSKAWVDAGADDELVKIIDNGPPENRIDVVFMGDGYTLTERDRFFTDIRRLTQDMWTGHTFASVRPLFNIWALFRPSNESGIGVGGKPKDTAFGLYRDGSELRGIYTSKPDAARDACTKLGPYGCDFPSLIANDEFYGGLGGEFVIATRSETSGTIVLRHEMGHSFIDVGEEYDGGEVYSGVNADTSLQNIKWKHWLTDPSKVREEKQVLRVQDYSWYDLAKGPYNITFRSDGMYKRWMMQISASGMEINGAMKVTLDNKPLKWTSNGNVD